MSDTDDRRLPRFVFGALTLLLVLAAVELTSFAAYRLIFTSWFAYGPDATRRAELQPSAKESRAAGGAVEEPRVRLPATMAEERLHPFIGFVHDYPGAPGGHLQTTPWGFYRRSADPPAADGAYRVGIVGGSAAFLFSFKGSRRLVDGIRDAPSVGGRPVEVVSLALGGFKQPQQLMTMSWLLSVGERFDLIVNLDGFNEVAFGVENHKRRVYPAYPRNWSLRIGGRDTLEDLEALGRAAVWSQRRRRWARAFDRPSAARTVTGNLIWRLLDRAAAARVRRSSGVDFHDLTRLYATVREPVYSDSCCHVNQRGNDLIADYLVETLLEGGSAGAGGP